MTISIPAGFAQRAKRHLRRTGRPLVYGPRRKSDLGLLAERNPASERWAVILDVTTLSEPLQEAILAKLDPERGPPTELMLRLAKYARIAVGDLPCVFNCGGQEIGRVDECDGLVVASSGLALSCLSHVFRYQEPRTGFFLRVLDLD